eukprot:19515-Heterococcus_DN1.PRE.1
MARCDQQLRLIRPPVSVTPVDTAPVSSLMHATRSTASIVRPSIPPPTALLLLGASSSANCSITKKSVSIPLPSTGCSSGSSDSGSSSSVSSSGSVVAAAGLAGETMS